MVSPCAMSELGVVAGVSRLVAARAMEVSAVMFMVCGFLGWVLCF